MANKTVYPYGTGGSLPSSVGIINDLVTGGADKALSAEQGKVLGNYVMDIYADIDFSSLTVSDYSLGTDDNWYAGGKHIVIPVTVGDTLQISATGPSSSDGGFYAFFTSEYTVPTSLSQHPPYVSGARQWTNPAGKTRVVPEGAAYLCICTKDGSGNKTWNVKKLVSEAQVIAKKDIVDNLDSELTDAPLSAKQGKVLGDAVFASSIPAGLTKYDYTGALVETKKKTHKVAQQIVSKITSVACQGGACFGDYLFLFKEENTTCWIYNLATQALVQTITIPSDQRGFVSDCHCNTVNFGTEYYDANDPFPLIYVSTGYASDGYTGALVYRIVSTTENDTTTYSLSLVQTIKMPGSGWTEFIVGDDGDCYIKRGSIFYRMTLPKLSAGDVILDYENALNVYKFTAQPFESANQNFIYFNGKIYLVSGASSAGMFIVLDLATQKREVVISLYDTLGITPEPETCFFWNNNLCISFRSNVNVRALYFE